MSIKSDKWIKKQCIHPSRRELTAENNPNGLYGMKLSPGSTEQDITASFAATDEFPEFKPMIAPFLERQVRASKDGKRAISFGVSSYGYDVRCASEFKIFTNVNSAEVDPKNFDEACYVDKNADELGYITIPPNGFALARTVEYFRIPRDVLVICLGKSTYARCGIIVNVTPLEPEWEGHVTLEFSNTTNLPARIYANEGVAQMLFLQSDEDCEISYGDRGGKYQGQTGVTIPRM